MSVKPTASFQDKQHDHPSPETLEEIANLPILTEQKEQVPFKSLYTSTGSTGSDTTSSPTDSKQQHLIIFIRHFFCGHCEDYIRSLSTHLPPSRLASANVNLSIIGCGEPAVVPDYKKRTNCPFLIYCDPQRTLLDLGEKKPEYVQSGLIGGTLSSMSNMIKSGGLIFKGGAYDQNGGEWLFEEGGRLVWCHRMRNTRDHAEIAEVEEVLCLREVEGQQ
ncbi:hypothetical protein D0859_15998 [Hortaea werneckii]|uniref:Thioredoxin domain-containing protein n=1 Tax=Hortaea werneckii TaxID=91943 RepID=A0A3M7I3G5_HORWE|nr:hypothetical protein D0859_15998 [Hortaea werneckii]